MQFDVECFRVLFVCFSSLLWLGNEASCSAFLKIVYLKNDNKNIGNKFVIELLALHLFSSTETNYNTVV